MSDLTFSEKAWGEYLDWQMADKATDRKINGLLKEISSAPFEETGRPEPLKNALAGMWSRRINGKHRLTYYTATGDKVRVAQCKGHYENK